MKPKDFTAIINKLKKAFTIQTDNNDHFFVYILYKGKHILHTKRSQGHIKDGDVHLIAKQLKLSTTKLIEYKSCHLTNNAYITLLQEKGVI